MGWFDDVLLVIRKNGLAKCLGNVACFAYSFHLGSDGDEETEFERGYHRSKAVAGRPVCGVEISEDNNAIFRSIWVSVFVFLIFEMAIDGSALPMIGWHLVLLLCNIIPGLGLLVEA